MTWFVDEYLDKTLRGLDLCPGMDVTLSFNGDAKDYSDDLDIEIYWSKPNSSTDWYPICNICYGLKTTIFRHEGTENPEHWHDLLEDAADALKEFLERGSKS